MSAYPSGGAAISNPPLYPLYNSLANFVTNGNSASHSPFSGPLGSPFDAMQYGSGMSVTKTANTADHSTGALSTGIGFESTNNGGPVGPSPGGPQPMVGMNTGNIIVLTSGTTKGIPANGPGSLNGFSDEYQPGISMPSGTSLANTPVGTNLYGAVLLAIGGGKNVITAGAGTDWSKGTSAPVPYNVQPLLDMGVGGSRDAGAGPTVFTGFGMKTVIATAGVAQGGVIETGFVNRTSKETISLATGMTAFGSSTTASPAVA
jgi:hypothetical protein